MWCSCLPGEVPGGVTDQGAPLSRYPAEDVGFNSGNVMPVELTGLECLSHLLCFDASKRCLFDGSQDTFGASGNLTTRCVNCSVQSNWLHPCVSFVLKPADVFPRRGRKARRAELDVTVHSTSTSPRLPRNLTLTPALSTTVYTLNGAMRDNLC